METTASIPDRGPRDPDFIPPAAEQPGEQVGPFTLLEVIGQGGFGTVWLAERRSPMVQRVALKIIKPGMDSAAVIARFEQERQALAVMDHPCVARIFDGGVSSRGRPYFAMEYVKGDPITVFCDKANLDINTRLELFTRVCEAVQHAHMKGIIHRDLKPSNILVQENDSGPLPKVIDFGVAKAISHSLSDKAVFTETGQLIGTPEYMSPEQTEMGYADVDTRTDVYSLGVVLYELLTGMLPFDSQELRSKGYAEIQRIIRETDPPRPSTKLITTDNAKAVAIAKSRQRQREHLASDLRRELEWIPLKAIRKDRRERYTTPTDLADDVRRYLRNEPIEAAPESAAYRARKFIRRHRGQVVAASIIVLSLVAGLASTLWQARAARLQRDAAVEARSRAEQMAGFAREQRDAALAARKRAETITEFVTATMKSADPQDAGSQQATILQAMDNATRDIREGRFKEDAETEAALKSTIGTILWSNGRPEDAKTLFTEALETRKRLFQGDHVDVATSLDDLAYALQEIGDADQAEKLYTQSYDMRRRLLPADDKDIAVSLNHLGLVNHALGRDDVAEKFYNQSMDMSKRLHADEQVIAEDLAGLAIVREGLGHLDDAEKYESQALEILKRLHPGDHPNVAAALNNLALTVEALGRPAEALTLVTQSLDMRRRLYKGDHAEIANSLKNLGSIQEDLHHEPEAEAAYVEALGMYQHLYKGDNPSIAGLLNSLASAQQSQGRLIEAEKSYIAALDMFRRLYPGDHPSVAACLSNIGFIRNNLGHSVEAEAPYRESLEMHRRLYKGDHPHVAANLVGLAFVLQALTRYDEARAMYQDALEMDKRLYKGDHPATLNVMGNLAGLLIVQRNTAEAEPLCLEALAMSRRLNSGDSPQVAANLADLAQVQQLQGKTTDARASFDEALRIRRAAAPKGSANLARLLWRSGVARMGTNDYAAAMPELDEALSMAQKFLPPEHKQLAEYREAVSKCRAALTASDPK